MLLENLKNTVLLFMVLSLTGGAMELALRGGFGGHLYYYGARVSGQVQEPEQKIMFLGDSFLAHWGTGTSLSELLTSKLGNSGVKILNTAGFGYGPEDYLIQVKAFIKDFRPDSVVLFYYAGNDLTDVQYRLGRKAWLKMKIKPWLIHFRSYWFLKSRLEVFRLKGLDYDSAFRKDIDPESLHLLRAGKINPWLATLGKTKPDYLRDNLLMESKESLKTWMKIRRDLLEINRITSEFKARMIVVVLPSTAQVNKSHHDFYRKLGFQTDQRMLIEQKPQELMAEFCAQVKIECLDLLPIMRGKNDLEFYAQNDDHFNENGNAFASEHIFNYLLTQHLISPERN